MTRAMCAFGSAEVGLHRQRKPLHENEHHGCWISCDVAYILRHRQSALWPSACQVLLVSPLFGSIFSVCLIDPPALLYASVTDSKSSPGLTRGQQFMKNIINCFDWLVGCVACIRRRAAGAVEFLVPIAKYMRSP